MSAALLLAAATACGEPAVDVALPDRADGARLADLAGILDVDVVGPRLEAVSESTGFDVVALTYETGHASCGEAFRAGGELVTAWDADVAVVAVARPGDFTASEGPRERCVGVRPRDEFAVPGALREEIAETLVPPIAATNDWDTVFTAALDRLAEGLATATEAPS